MDLWNRLSSRSDILESPACFERRVGVFGGWLVMNQSVMGVIVGGGPAPGINGVIGAAAIEAVNNGLKVLGFYDGFSHLAGGDFDHALHTRELQIKDLSRVHFDGGSILRTSRTSLLNQAKLKSSTVVEPDTEKTARVYERLRSLSVTHL